MLPLSSLQLVEVALIRFTQRTVNESFSHGKHRGLLVQDVAALGRERNISLAGTASDAEAATVKGCSNAGNFKVPFKDCVA